LRIGELGRKGEEGKEGARGEAAGWIFRGRRRCGRLGECKIMKEEVALAVSEHILSDLFDGFVSMIVCILKGLGQV